MGKTIVITSGKGGVGKTTTTANLGAALAMFGKSVVVVDADIGLRNLDVVMGLENRIVYNLVDVIEGKCRIKQALIKDKRYEGLYLLAAAQTKDKDCINPLQMKKLCLDLQDSFEFVLVDSPAGIENGFKNAVAGAGQSIIVTTPEISAVRDADRIIGLLEAGGLYQNYLLINRVRPDLIKKGDMMDINDVIDILSLSLIGVVPDNKDIVVSTNKGEPIASNDKSLAGRAFKNIAARLMGQNVPFLDLKDNTSVLVRFAEAISGAGR